MGHTIYGREKKDRMPWDRPPLNPDASALDDLKTEWDMVRGTTLHVLRAGPIFREPCKLVSPSPYLYLEIVTTQPLTLTFNGRIEITIWEGQRVWAFLARSAGASSTVEDPSSWRRVCEAPHPPTR